MMYRKGHVGIVLLALAPVLYVLLSTGRFLLAVLACFVLVIEPLPDYDQRLSVLTHRGTSHSLVTAGLVGILCAGLGWGGGQYVIVPAVDWLSTETTPTSPVLAVVERINTLDPWIIALFGLFVGAGGIVLHLLGDIITVSGIRPFLPVSHREIALSEINASDPFVNGGLFVLGLLAMLILALAVTPLDDLLMEIWRGIT